MSYLALVYYPIIEHEGFHNFRMTYEPYATLLPPHIPFIFPLEESFGIEKLKSHIQRVLIQWKAFDMHFCKLEKTWDHWLFLGAVEGDNKAIELHDDLYEGALAPYLREDLPYTPHIGLGLFSTENYDFHNPTAKLSLDQEKYNRGRQEFEDLDFALWCHIDELTLVRVNEEFTSCEDVFSFRLNE